VKVFTRAKKLVDAIHAQHPEVRHADILWAAKRRMALVIAKEWESVDNVDAILALAKDRPPIELPELGPLCRICRVQHLLNLGCPQQDP